MLLRKAILDEIQSGEVDLVFRRWTRPTVKGGGTLRTSVGLVRIVAVEEVALYSIDDAEAARAGVSLEELKTFLTAKTEGSVYKVTLGGIAPDPRVALREQADLTDDELDALIGRLDRLDRAGARGPWTRQYLALLGEQPHVRAQDLADGLGMEKMVFKNDVRKLKELGLTISHSPGYELSPRGQAVLDRLTGA